MVKHTLPLFLAFGFCWPSATVAAPKFCGIDLDHFIEASTDSGFYLELAKKISKKGNVPFEYVILPWQRAAYSMASGRCQCFMGGDAEVAKFYAGPFAGLVDFISTKPMWTQNLVIYTRKDRPKITGLEQLKGKQIGIVLGIDLKHAKLEPYKKTVHRIYSRVSLFSMLKMERLDAVVAYWPLARVFGDDFHFDKRLKLTTENPGFFCLNNSRTKKVLSQMDEGFRKLKKEGAFQKDFDRHFFTRQEI